MLEERYFDLQESLKWFPFGNIDEETFCSCEIEDFMENTEIPDDWEWSYGISKLVLLPCDTDYVVKIPFSALLGDTDDYSFFGGALYPLTCELGWDYCRSEAEYYQIAKKAGINKFFAPTKYVGNIASWPVYIQKRCYSEDTFKVSHSDEVLKRTKEWKEGNSNQSVSKMSANFVADLLIQNGEEEVKKLFDFLKEQSIYDFHSGNCGYDSDGRAILIDYSSFDD